MKYGLLQDNMSCFTSDLCGGTAWNGTKVRKIAHFLKKYLISFGGFKKTVYLCIAIKKNGPVAQLNRASDYGSEGYRFESCRGHFKRDAKQLTINCLAFFLLTCCQIYALFCPTQLLAIFTERHPSPTNIYAFQHQKPITINIHSGRALSFQ